MPYQFVARFRLDFVASLVRVNPIEMTKNLFHFNFFASLAINSIEITNISFLSYFFYFCTNLYLSLSRGKQGNRGHTNFCTNLIALL